MNDGALITIVLSALAGIIWAVRVEGRVNSHEVHHANVKESLGTINRELLYIRERIDDFMGPKRGVPR